MRTYWTYEVFKIESDRTKHLMCLDLQDWRLEIRPEDHGLLVKVWEMVTRQRFVDACNDPHTPPWSWKTGRWIETAERLLADGAVILVNCAGGMTPPIGVAILATIRSDRLEWPEYFEDERITISRWPRARYYYLCSNHNRLFPEKFNSYQQAEAEARKYTDKITSNCWRDSIIMEKRMKHFFVEVKSEHGFGPWIPVNTIRAQSGRLAFAVAEIHRKERYPEIPASRQRVRSVSREEYRRQTAALATRYGYQERARQMEKVRIGCVSLVSI